MSPDIKYFASLSLKRWWAAALIDWAVIIFMFAVLFALPHTPWLLVPWTILTTLVTGIWRHRLSLLGHEAAHSLISRNDQTNHLLANLVVFWPNLLQSHRYQGFHLSHHRLLGTTDDPELAHKRLNPKLWLLPLSRKRLYGRIALGLVGGLSKETVLIFKMIGPRRISDLDGPFTWWLVVVNVLTWSLGFGHALAFVGIWALSTVTSFITIFHVRMLLEHHATDSTHRVKASTLQRLLIMPHGEHCHYEHHAYPYIPFFRLDDARWYMSDATAIKKPEEIFKSFEKE